MKQTSKLKSAATAARPTLQIDAKNLQAIRIEDQFYPAAQTMRKHFQERFENPLVARMDRFTWDYWSVPDQYKLLRVPMEQFFPESMAFPFLDHLLQWGRKNLGCQMISHPWLSAYVDGCFQALHSDVPHGPWSFVYSLTPWQTRRFTGGETLVATEKLTGYFAHARHDQSAEKKDFFHRIEPRFNRLTVFDPRYPHGVEQLRGEDELVRSRLVIHGWFTEPRPTLEGALSLKKAVPTMDFLAQTWMEEIQTAGFTGLLAIQLRIHASGKIKSTEVLCGHLVNAMGRAMTRNEMRIFLSHALMQAPAFPKAAGETTITMPLEFRA